MPKIGERRSKQRSHRVTQRRAEIRLQKKRWVTNDAPIILGLDPGFAATGYCLLQRIGGHVVPLTVGVIETTKTPKKQMRDMRVTADDYRRIKEIYYALQKLMQDFKPVAIAYEVYQPFAGPQMRTGAWKTARVEGLLVGIGLQHEAMVLPYLTIDLKNGIAVARSATKAQVERAIVDLVPELRPKFEAVAKTKREHVADAAGYAYLAVEELQTMAKALGV